MDNPVIAYWYDLVFHVFAHLSVVSEDRSSLFSERYVACVRDHLKLAGAWNHGTQSMSSIDPDLADFYRASQQGFLLQMLPTLWDNYTDFARDLDLELPVVDWPDAIRGTLAVNLHDRVPPELIYRFRSAIAAENVRHAAVWAAMSRRTSKEYLPLFAKDITSFARLIPGLTSVRWRLCHPLCRHGRAFGHQANDLTICVGVADPKLDVPEGFPVFQGCHEYFAAHASMLSGSVFNLATIPGLDGFSGFCTNENIAFCLGARAFANSPWRIGYLAWLGEVANCISPVDLMSRLAQGTHLPEAGLGLVEDLHAALLSEADW